MNKDVLLVVITIDETVAALNIEPFDSASYLGSNNFLLNWSGFFLLSLNLGIGWCFGVCHFSPFFNTKYKFMMVNLSLDLR
jgi:hypothetical protein